MSRPRCARRARAIAQTYSGAANQATEAWVARACSRQSTVGCNQDALVADRYKDQLASASCQTSTPRPASDHADAKAPTSSGSNWVPAQRSSSSSALSGVQLARYGRVDVIASNE